MLDAPEPEKGRPPLLLDEKLKKSAKECAKVLEEENTIELTRGQYTILDIDDYNRLSGYKWCAVATLNGRYYAKRNIRIDGKQKAALLHRTIMGLTWGDGKEVDHINRNPLDNRKINLRLCTRTQNQENKDLSKNNTSGYRGVHWNKSARCWIGQIRYKGKRIFSRKQKTKELAAEWYNKMAKKLFGEFAYKNKII
jgi:hypothetical protein